LRPSPPAWHLPHKATAKTRAVNCMRQIPGSKWKGRKSPCDLAKLQFTLKYNGVLNHHIVGVRIK
jgi:hypothetical protein